MLIETLAAYSDQFNPCFVLLRTEDDKLSNLVSAEFKGRVTVLGSEKSHLGMGASLAEGVRQIRESHKLTGLFVGLADMPCIARETLATLHRAMEQGSTGLLRPEFEGKPGHPVAFSEEYFLELTQLSGDSGAISLLQRHSQDIKHVPINDPGVHQDFDHPP